MQGGSLPLPCSALSLPPAVLAWGCLRGWTRAWLWCLLSARSWAVPSGSHPVEQQLWPGQDPSVVGTGGRAESNEVGPQPPSPPPGKRALCLPKKRAPIPSRTALPTSFSAASLPCSCKHLGCPWPGQAWRPGQLPPVGPSRCERLPLPQQQVSFPSCHWVVQVGGNLGPPHTSPGTA